MKNWFIMLSLLLLCNWGCQPKSDELLVTECVGLSEYIIDNKSSFDLSVEFTYSNSFGSQKDSLQTIGSKQQKTIAHDSNFGALPKPTDTFIKLILYRYANGRKHVAYIQDPIVNARWVKTKRNSTDPDFGCYCVTNTLLITNDDSNDK